MTLVEEAIQLVAVKAGKVIELERTQPGGISMTTILPPMDMVQDMLAASTAAHDDRARMQGALEGFWQIANDSELPWATVRDAAIAAAQLDYNLFFMLISYLLERQNDII
jgi:hypothetical protein